jgi:hypothetical protein
MSSDFDSESTAETAEPKKLTPMAHALCGWPLVLVILGGAIGGGLGGAAYGINTAIYKSNFPAAAKIALNLITGLTAIGIWLTIAIAISNQVQQL